MYFLDFLENCDVVFAPYAPCRLLCLHSLYRDIFKDSTSNSTTISYYTKCWESVFWQYVTWLLTISIVRYSYKQTNHFNLYIQSESDLIAATWGVRSTCAGIISNQTGSVNYFGLLTAWAAWETSMTSELPWDLAWEDWSSCYYE